MFESKEFLFAGMGVVVMTGWVFKVDCADKMAYIMNCSCNLLIFQCVMKSTRRQLSVRARSLALCLLFRVKHIGELIIISPYLIITKQHPNSILVPILKLVHCLTLGSIKHSEKRHDVQCTSGKSPD